MQVQGKLEICHIYRRSYVGVMASPSFAKFPLKLLGTPPSPPKKKKLRKNSKQIIPFQNSLWSLSNFKIWFGKVEKRNNTRPFLGDKASPNSIYILKTKINLNV